MMDEKKTQALQLTRADLECLGDVAELFDQYRQFYEEPADLEKARDFVSQRMANGESVIFLARLGEKPAGFVQLYGSFCSIAARPMWILYDLYVTGSCRGQGVGEALMNRARDLARETGASRIDLSTATNNHVAQRLYERLGYERDEAFFVYSLET
jgi:ribosomal protein S18 acetylase RimI-like enzyme